MRQVLAGTKRHAANYVVIAAVSRGYTTTMPLTTQQLQLLILR
jgi:hypothetical protein